VCVCIICALRKILYIYYDNYCVLY
jgi:hypothetical protein